MVSLQLQKLHNLLPCQFLLTKLSLVRVTPLQRYHIKILILRGILRFQSVLCVVILLLFNMALYMDCTVKTPLLVSFHLKMSLLLFSRICAMRLTRLCQRFRLCPLSDLRKETLSGILSNTKAIEACFFLVILYKVGY